MDEIYDILDDLGLTVDYKTCTTLVDDASLESLDTVPLISDPPDAFDITIPAREITPENFNSAEAMYDMVKRLQDE